MPRLAPISWRELVRGLKRFGFEGPYQGGRHPYLVKGDLVLTVPNPHRGDISLDLLSRILRQAGITRDQWVER